jgi:hypothetical protein
MTIALQNVAGVVTSRGLLYCLQYLMISVKGYDILSAFHSLPTILRALIIAIIRVTMALLLVHVYLLFMPPP